MRKFVFLLGNPLVKAATYEAYSLEEAWDYAREEFGGNVFFDSAQMHELLDEEV